MASSADVDRERRTEPSRHLNATPKKNLVPVISRLSSNASETSAASSEGTNLTRISDVTPVSTHRTGARNILSVLDEEDDDLDFRYREEVDAVDVDPANEVDVWNIEVAEKTFAFSEESPETSKATFTEDRQTRTAETGEDQVVRQGSLPRSSTLFKPYKPKNPASGLPPASSPVSPAVAENNDSGWPVEITMGTRPRGVSSVTGSFGSEGNWS